MPTRAQIDARKAVAAAVVNGHNTFAGAFNAGQSALTPYKDEPEVQPLISKLNEAARAHNESVPLVIAERDRWNAAVPSDPLPTPTVDTIVTPVGWIGGTGTTSTSGWACDAYDTTKTATVRVLVDGVEVARVLANDPSPDVLAAGIGNGANRFHASFPEPAPGPHQVSVQVVGPNYTLQGCPVTVNVVNNVPTPGGTESPDESGVAAGGGFLTDRYGDQWSVTAAGKVLKNGQSFTNQVGSTGRMQTCDGLRYSRHIVWGHSADNSWFQWFYTDPTRTLGDWAFCNPVPFWGRPFASLGITPHASESPHKTRGSTCNDYLGRVWTFGGPGSNGNLQVLKNGQVTGAEAVEFTYMNHTVVLKDALGRYWDQEENILGTTFVLMENSPDPIAVEEGTVDYGPVDEGYRGTHTEAELQADPQFEWPDSIDGWGINPGLYLPGLVNFTTWPSYGNVKVLSSSGKPWNGPNMFNATRGFTTRTDSKWLHQSLRVRANTVANMHEQGIKLSELGANSTNPNEQNFISVRLWLRPPYHCLPDRFQVAIYVYDLEAFPKGDFGEVLMSRGFIKAEDIEALSLFCKGNTFQANGTTPNTDGQYIIRSRGRDILNVANRLNRGTPDMQFSFGSLQTYHGGMGAPCADFANPTGNAITIEMAPPDVGPVDPGFRRPALVPPGPSPTVNPLWMAGRQKYVPMVIAGSLGGYWPGQFAYSGWAADRFNGNALARFMWAGGHALNNDNSIALINFKVDHPTIITELAGSSAAIQGAGLQHDAEPGSLPGWLACKWPHLLVQLASAFAWLATRFAFTASQPEARSTGYADAFDPVARTIRAMPGIPDFLGLGRRTGFRCMDRTC
jgi:hypothetical protein